MYSEAEMKHEKDSALTTDYLTLIIPQELLPLSLRQIVLYFLGKWKCYVILIVYINK
jgi:hypothetical protein